MKETWLYNEKTRINLQLEVASERQSVDQNHINFFCEELRDASRTQNTIETERLNECKLYVKNQKPKLRQLRAKVLQALRRDEMSTLIAQAATFQQELKEVSLLELPF